MKFTAYMCGIDFTDERGERQGGNLIFATPEAVKKHRHGGDDIFDECGIAEVEVSLKRWVVPQDLLKNIRK